jgi:DNA-binding NarL/FixJ family response regulator
MGIKVLVADDSDVMRSAIAELLAGDSDLQVVGEATSFAETLALTSSLQPDIVLLDLHMADEREYLPDVVKAQLSESVYCVLAISLCNDAEANALAESFGARALLDKANLYSALIPAIKLHCPNGTDERAGTYVRRNGQSVAADPIPKGELSGAD